MKDSLKKINEDIKNFKGLAIARNCFHPVLGEGNNKAKIMFIGEAPGKLEDEEGRPFVGRSGKLLNELLENAGIDRANVYITNIVKYRPPKNRDPNENEKKLCGEFLKREIALINPTIIATLGRHSMGYFLPLQKISEIHGTKTIIKNQIYFPLYHPASALYNPNIKKTLIADMKKLATLINKNDK